MREVQADAPFPGGASRVPSNDRSDMENAQAVRERAPRYPDSGAAAIPRARRWLIPTDPPPV